MYGGAPVYDIALRADGAAITASPTPPNASLTSALEGPLDPGELHPSTTRVAARTRARPSFQVRDFAITILLTLNFNYRKNPVLLSQSYIHQENYQCLLQSSTL